MGGNIFNNTSNIEKDLIKETINSFFDELELLGIKKINYTIVGSAGKKETSGDIDLGIDTSEILKLKSLFSNKDFIIIYDKYKKRSRTASDSQIITRSILTLLANKINKSNKIQVSNKITSSHMFFNAPQFNNNKRVQIDWIVGDIKWIKFSSYSKDYADKTIKGLHRTQLILSIFNYYGYSFNHNIGVKNTMTGEIVASNPNEVLALLQEIFCDRINKEILNDYELLYKCINDEILDIFIKILDRTRCDIPTNIQDYWLSNQSRLGLTGKFLPPNSKIYSYLSNNIVK